MTLPVHLEDIARDVRAWQSATFELQPTDSLIRKLLDEYQEFLFPTSVPNQLEESVDVFFLLAALDARRVPEGFTPVMHHIGRHVLPSVTEASVRHKLEINKSRRWKLGKDGTWSHIG